MARHWTASERAKQSAAIIKWKPWKSSTGPKTLEGKAKAAGNAYKGATRAAMKELRVLLKQQKRDLDLIK